MYHVGQQLKNCPLDNEPSFIIVKITYSMVTPDDITYHLKDINGNRVQKTSEEFLYPYN
jgi:hypothetical protein